MPPVIKAAELVEGHEANDGVPLVVVGDRHVAGNAIIGRGNSGSDGPMLAGIGGIGDVGVVLISGGNLLRVVGVDRYRGLREKAGIRGDGGDFRTARLRKRLGACGNGKKSKEQSHQHEPRYVCSTSMKAAPERHEASDSQACLRGHMASAARVSRRRLAI